MYVIHSTKNQRWLKWLKTRIDDGTYKSFFFFLWFSLSLYCFCIVYTLNDVQRRFFCFFVRLIVCWLCYFYFIRFIWNGYIVKHTCIPVHIYVWLRWNDYVWECFFFFNLAIRLWNRDETIDVYMCLMLDSL